MTALNANPDPHDLSPEAFEQLLANGAGTCPHPDLVAAVHEGVLPEDEAAPIREHLSHCQLCSLLLPNEMEDQLPAFSTADEARILARIEATAPASAEVSPKIVPIASQRSNRRTAMFAIAAGFLVAAILTGVHIYSNAAHDSSTVAQTPVPQKAVAPQSIERQQALQQLATLEPLPPPAPQTTDLIARGDGSAAQPTADELLPGFRAYNNHDYDAAIRVFAPLAARYPHAELPGLYLGISQFESYQDAAAAQTFATLAASPTASPDALWFAAVAAARTQDNASAASLFQRLCTTQPSGNRHEQACHLATVFRP